MVPELGDLSTDVMWLPVMNRLTLPLVAVKLDRSVTDGVLSCLKLDNKPSSERSPMSTALVAISVAMYVLSPWSSGAIAA